MALRDLINFFITLSCIFFIHRYLYLPEILPTVGVVAATFVANLVASGVICSFSYIQESLFIAAPFYIYAMFALLVNI